MTNLKFELAWTKGRQFEEALKVLEKTADRDDKYPIGEIRRVVEDLINDLTQIGEHKQIQSRSKRC